MRCWLNVKPDLLSEICAKLPANIGLAGIPLGSSSSGTEEAGNTGGEPAERTTPSRKRSRSLMSHAVESVVSESAPNKAAERAFLMQSIKHAVEVLAVARGSELDPEVVETVKCELQQCAKRLKMIQREQAEVDEETEDEKDNA
ncbi:hypothetical protein ON010_g10532 [Phytophthora cinnamomi]|nr:hypothetical protein ON010_g10532 [Phytophthora cinnamomi]